MILSIVAIASLAGVRYQWDTPPASEAATTAYEPVAVVELFTSQGCSSCPPADQLLGTLVDQANQQQQPIYALSFHVAYWNYLGWRDPFSQEAFTDRQRQYARTLNESVYTPQMIVNGASVFVGSKAATADTEIQKALQRSATHAVALAAQATDDSVRVQFDVDGPTKGRLLQLALVERGLSVDVKRGENGGRTLHHDNVVRQLKTLSLDKTSQGTISLKLPDGLDPQNTSVIAYVQNAQSLIISGASRAALDAS